MNTEITALESALNAISDDSSKVIHLDPRQARELREYIDSLERDKAKLQAIIMEHDEQATLIRRGYQALVREWANNEDI